MSKTLVCLTTIATFIALFCAGSSWANVPAPPVNQQLGIDDSVFNNLTQAECRSCHDDPNVTGPTPNEDRHHLLWGLPLMQGKCSYNLNLCLSDADCNPGICEFNGTPCTVDANCPDAGFGETCGEVCRGETAVTDLDADNNGAPDTNYACLSCHRQVIEGGIIRFLVEEDCLVCHVQVGGEGSVHHLSTVAQGLDSPLGDDDKGDCTPCHGTIVDDIGDGHIIPTYNPSLVTPSPSGGDGLPLNSEDNGSGACDYCHSSGTGDGYNPGIEDSGVLVYGNEALHHNTGVYLSETGAVNDATCTWCHNVMLPNAYAIRVCEGCHGLDSLHNIAADSDTGCFYKPGDQTCTVDIGGEAPGYSHVGNDSDCWGCHGFASQDGALGTGPVTPSIKDSSIIAMTAGTDKVVTLTGAAFTNLVGTQEWVSHAVLTAADGSSLSLVPSYITQGSMTFTIPGTLATGNYEIRAVKSNGVVSAESNPVVISVKPDVVITDARCDQEGGSVTLVGSGFGGVPPEGAESYLNVEMGGVPQEIIAWADTQVQASIAGCQGTATINALYGSATYCVGTEVCDADCDKDSNVNLSDLQIMKTEYFRTNCNTTSCRADCNGDGMVNLSDLTKMKAEYFRNDCCQ